MSLNPQVVHVVLYEGAGAEPLSSDKRLAALSNLLGRGYAVTLTRDEISVPTTTSVTTLVMGQFGPSSRAFPGTDRGRDAADEESVSLNVRFSDVTALDANQIAEQVETVRGEINAAKHGEWKPWFPVIDYDRCTNCMQCLSFCLFGVYGVDSDQRIQVQNNDNCKTNCPACSRVCPEAAIMFPKYKAGPINGDLVSDADLQREKMKIDISALLGGDVYQMLRERSERAKSRFSKERDSEKALKERQKCLVKLAQAGDIPPEVLMALPSPEEIQRRAEEAKAKAQAALAQQPT